MFFKVTLLALCVTVAYGDGGYSSFSYGVSDPNTGDVKDQHEKRIGDSVVGQYSLLESDGTKRIVDYAAHPHTGFNAVVRKDPGLSVHPAPAAYAGYGSALGYGAQATPLAYGAHATPLAYGAHASNLAYGGYAAAAPVAYAAHAPAVSAYSTTVAHGGYASPQSHAGLGYGSYGSYGGHGGAYGLGYNALAHGNGHSYGYSGYGGYGLGAGGLGW